MGFLELAAISNACSSGCTDAITTIKCIKNRQIMKLHSNNTKRKSEQQSRYTSAEANT